MSAAFLLALFLAQSAEDVPGRYIAQGGAGACPVTLRPAADQLPESNLEGETASGFAFAAPGCPGGLSAASLWRLTLADGVLILADGAGRTLFEGRADGPDWAGETPQGEALTLRPR